MLAAGALLPFVGWRPSAATALNLELAQNNSAPETKDAAAPSRMGAILVSEFGPVKIHSYLSPADGLRVNTQMIEGPNAVVVFDGQLLLPYADEVASHVQMLDKPVDRIILSHAHTDHWGGLQVLTFEDDGAIERELSRARVAVMQAALDSLDGETSPAAMMAREKYAAARDVAEDQSEPQAATKYDELRLRAIAAQRAALQRLRARGEIGEEAFHRIQEELDWSELDAAPAGSFQSLAS